MNRISILKLALKVESSHKEFLYEAFQSCKGVMAWLTWPDSIDIFDSYTAPSCTRPTSNCVVLSK